MAAKIRLKKVGRKGQPSYRVVVLDGRKPRDAKVVADLGHYDPKTDPPSFEVDNEVALKWLLDGAKATKAARNILSKAGVMAAWNAVARGGTDVEQVQELAAQVVEDAKKKGEKKAKAKAKAKAEAAETDAKAGGEAVAETEEAAVAEESVENEAEAPEASAEEKP